MKRNGFLLVESLFALSLFISCVIILMSMYGTVMKENTRIQKDYINYKTEQSNMEKEICLSFQ